MSMVRAAAHSAALAVACVAFASSAQADVTISSGATQNMTCSAGVCAPTATDAALNVTDLENLLATGNVSIVTTNGNVQANNIDITAAFSWSAVSGLTLDAYESISFSADVTDQGTGNVSLVTDDGGSGGALTFTIGEGELTLASVSSRLIINGTTYRLTTSVKQLAAEIAAKPKGRFALANDYNANQDGVYSTSPIQTSFFGIFNGLGHEVSKLEISDKSDNSVGLFADVSSHGVVTSIVLRNAVVWAMAGNAGVVAGENDGAVSNAFGSGRVYGVEAGGLVGYNLGNIDTSQSSAHVKGDSVGGLVGLSAGSVSLSFASGNTIGREVGGLVGIKGGMIENSYASGAATNGNLAGLVGGLVGSNNSGSINTSYSIGAVSGPKKALVGGFDGSDQGTIVSSYWDTTTSGTDQGSGDGNESGITGLTTEQLQSGLPSGFDPAIWAESSNVNNGFPYLIANPPPK